MSICYDETSVFTGSRSFKSSLEQDATKYYLQHYANMLLLSFIARASADRSERAQANKELLVAQRKCDYWARHPNYNKEVALREIQKLKAQYAPQRKAA